MANRSTEDSVRLFISGQKTKSKPFPLGCKTIRTGLVTNWAAHSVYPKKANENHFRTTIGNKQCTQPYDASIFNISAMSYGALSKTAVTSLNKGAQLGHFAQHGEGGIDEYHLQGGDLIWQIGTGYFGWPGMKKAIFQTNCLPRKSQLSAGKND